jgi:micrococcal nuclease
LKRRTVRLLTRLLIALLLVGLGYLSEQNTELKKDLVSLSPGTYAVTQFHDGDTINVNMDGQEEEIRFIGVDTPETQDPRKAVQCFGKAASEFTKLLIGSQPVRLEADPLSSNRDRYGFALTGFPHTKMDEFIGYQREAREQNRGLWSSCEPTESTPGRFTSNDAL